MATNDFLPFAAAGGANVVTQAAYAALGALSTGYQAGVANSAQLNKTWRQSSIMAAVLAQFIANASGANSVDDGTTATLLANLTSIFQNTSLTFGIDTGTANVYAVNLSPPAPAYIDGMVLRVKIANSNTSASTLNVNGLGAVNIYGLAGSALQGGELSAGGTATFIYRAAASVFVLLSCTGGALQIPPGAQSNQAVNFGQFPFVLSSNGYQKLPSGMIIQWGAALTTSGSDLTVTLPIAFPNNFFQVVGSGDYSVGSNILAYFGATPNGSKNSFVARSSGNITMRYIAIGN